MDEEQIVHALMTPIRRFPRKALVIATEHRDLGVAAARTVLGRMAQEARTAQPRRIEGTPYFDPAVNFGAIHACWLLGFHRATEAEAEFDEVVHLNDSQLDALFGDTTHETLPPALDFAVSTESLLRWTDDSLAFDAEASVHDALIRHAIRGDVARVTVLDRVAASLARHTADPAAVTGRQFASLAYLGVCLADEAGPVVSLLQEGTDPEGTFTYRDIELLPRTEEELRATWGDAPTPKHPKDVEDMGIYAWQDPKPTTKKRPRKKKPKRKKKR